MSWVNTSKLFSSLPRFAYIQKVGLISLMRVIIDQMQYNQNFAGNVDLSLKLNVY